MRQFIIIATSRVHGERIEFDMEVRIVVRADSLADAYKKVRKHSEFRNAYLRQE